MRKSDAYLAGWDASELACILDAWKTETPDMGVLALVPEACRNEVPGLQALCRERGISLVGGIFPAILTEAGFHQTNVWLLRTAPALQSFLLADLPRDAREAAEAMGQAVEARLGGGEGQRRPGLYMIFDGLVPHIASILDNLYQRLADRVSYAGVNAGSETFQPMPCLFDGERIVGNGVLGLLMPEGWATVLAHGYAEPERVMSATGTEGNRIIQIDWQPAFDAYQTIIRAEYGIELTRENFYEYGVHFPFGILRANTEVVVRIPVAVMEDGSLFCVGEVPENSMLVLLKAPECVAEGGIHALAEGLQEANGSMEGRRMLGFYCAGRRMHFGETAVEEVKALHQATGVSTLMGALSLGEIGSTHDWGYPLFHNATLVCTPWGKA